MMMGHSHDLNNTFKTLSGIQIKCTHLFDRRRMLPVHCNGKPSIQTIEFYAMRWSTHWSQSSRQIKILILFTRGQLRWQPAVKYTSPQASRNASYQLKSPPPGLMQKWHYMPQWTAELPEGLNADGGPIKHPLTGKNVKTKKKPNKKKEAECTLCDRKTRFRRGHLKGSHLWNV